MIKELDLIPRLLYSILFVGLGFWATGLKSPAIWATVFINILLFSFIWQYGVLHFALKKIEASLWRLGALFVWIALSALVGFWSLTELADFDYLQSDDIDTVVHSFAQTLAIYCVANEMFIAGACARRAFQKYNAL